MKTESPNKSCLPCKNGSKCTTCIQCTDGYYRCTCIFFVLFGGFLLIWLRGGAAALLYHSFIKLFGFITMKSENRSENISNDIEMLMYRLAILSLKTQTEWLQKQYRTR